MLIEPNGRPLPNAIWPKRHDSRIQTALERLRAAGPKRLSVAELARAARLSPPRFSHLFALATGLPPGRYMRRTREQPDKA